jgi:hypothetical protein
MLTFKTLMLREWMQHQRGWLILAGAPFVFMLLALVFGGVHTEIDDSGPSGVLVALSAGYTVSIALMAWIAVGFQAAGLARRDQQDRSIEFWRSLPVADWQAVSSTTLTHFLLFPLAVTAIASGCGLLISMLVVVRLFGFAALGSLPWGDLLGAWSVAVPRLLLGVVLASFWAAPALLLVMAASTWLKRWGLPALGAFFGLGGLILARGYNLPQVFEAIQALSERFVWAVVPFSRGAANVNIPEGFARLPSALAQDAALAFSDLASPLSLLALAISAGSFALIVYGRRKSGE